MMKEILNEQIDVIENNLYKFSPAIMKILIRDNTTKRNLCWATNTYEKFGEWFLPEKEMHIDQLVNANILTPRVSKSVEEQQARTKDKGEVFTPAWMCNMQVNFLDEDWFGRKNVFNTEIENGWKTNKKKITFSQKLKKTWQEYVSDTRLEITCGEAPYLVSRYDVVKGEVIPVENRIGILDRKLRIINENVDDEEEWIQQAEIAFKSTYGYDYQGDNVVIARENLLYTLIDNMMFKFGHQPDVETLKRFATIVSWNIWQMDGLDYTIPYSEVDVQKEQVQLNLFGDEPETVKKEKQLAKIRNWETNKTIEFKEILGGKKMKFDYIIGNPPYQKETDNTSATNGQAPRTNIFHYFQLQADKISNVVTCLIYPGIRWIHQSGKGVERFGKNQINDVNLSKLVFYRNANEVFKNSGITDGISIVLKNKYKVNQGFEYTYKENSNSVVVKVDNPRNELLPINPNDSIILSKISKFVAENNLKTLNEGILSRSLFGIESDFAFKNPGELREKTNETKIDFNKEVKILVNDKAGAAGRSKWYIGKKELVKQNSELISEWQVVVSSAHPGGQAGRDNQLELIDNHSVFGRSRVALRSFKDIQSAKNFYKYMNTLVVKYAFLMTDEALTSLGKRVPDLIEYKNNSLVDFSMDLDEQVNKLIGLTKQDIEYMKTTISNSKGV